MNKKISLGIAISLIAIACAVTFVVTMTVSLNLYNDKIAGVQQREEINTRIQEIDSFVRNYSLYTIDDTSIKTGIYEGFLDGIADKHSGYYTTDEYYYKNMLDSGMLTGLGIETVNDGGYLKITTVYENSSAYEAGIEVGNVISAVGNENVLEIGYAAASSQIRFGDEGTKTSVTVRKGGEETVHSLTRKAFEINSVSSTLLDNGILYLDFSTIHNLTGTQTATIIDGYKDENITGYILDLRNLESGNYSSAAAILDPFVSQLTVATALYRNNSTTVIGETTAENFTELPISVITNEKTGGAAELIAVTLRDTNGAKIVGAATMGYGTLQEARAFSDGTAVEISVATIIPANKDSAYNEDGVKPEFAVEYAGLPESSPENYANTYDEQYKKAVEVIISDTNASASE